jgi:hypothetical protein
MWDNLPAYGYYLRHARNVVFTNCTTSAVAADARPWIATNDVTQLDVSSMMKRLSRAGGQ